MWGAAAAPQSLDALARQADTTPELAAQALARLGELGLLSEDVPGFDRRQFLQRGALVGAGAIAIPAITTLIAPAAAFASSNIGDGGKAVAGATYMLSVLGGGGGTGQATTLGTGGKGGVGALITGIYTAPSAGIFSIYVGGPGATGTVTGTAGGTSVENGTNTYTTGGAGGTGTSGALGVVTQGGGGSGGGVSAILFTPTGGNAVLVVAAGAGGGGNGAAATGTATAGGAGSLTSVATPPTAVTVGSAGSAGGGGGGGGATGGTGGSTTAASGGGTSYFPSGFTAKAGTNAGAAGSVAIVHNS